MSQTGIRRSNAHRVFDRVVRSIVVGVLVAACSSDSGLGSFTSDGCSLFPDSSLITKDDWCECCFTHDISYWKGGTYEEREAADARLRDCVREKTGNETLAVLMYEGVRFGGSPYFYNWYRWGYGWSYDRKYQALSPAERSRADELVQKYFDSIEKPVCPRS